jgi:hypothetical protein
VRAPHAGGADMRAARRVTLVLLTAGRNETTAATAAAPPHGQPPPQGGAPCEDARGCFLAGDCVGGACVCDAWATGANCSMLNLAPADPANGLQIPGSHTWGGHAVKDTSTGVAQYHGYFSFMLGGCTLSSWTSNSALIHAVSDSPDGPFTPAGPSVTPEIAGVVVPPWAHSAFITWSPVDKLWLLSHIGPGGVQNHGCRTQPDGTQGCWNLTDGCTRRNSGGACTRCDTQGSTPPECWKNCSAVVPSESGGEIRIRPNEVQQGQRPWWHRQEPLPRGPAVLPAGLQCRNAKYHKPVPGEYCLDFYVHTAVNVSGPWSAPLELSTVDNATQHWYGGGGNNPSMPALFLFPNGTTLLYYQATSCPNGWGNMAPACVGVMRAPS